MILWRVETCENLHAVNDLALFFGLLALLFLSPLEIEEASLEHELLSTNSFIDARIVELYHIILQLYIMLCIVIEVLKICQQGVSICIILLVEVSSLGHVPDDLVKVRNATSSTSVGTSLRALITRSVVLLACI